MTPKVLEAEYATIRAQIEALAPTIAEIVEGKEKPKARLETVVSLAFLANKLMALTEALKTDET